MFFKQLKIKRNLQKIFQCFDQFKIQFCAKKLLIFEFSWCCDYSFKQKEEICNKKPIHFKGLYDLLKKNLKLCRTPTNIYEYDRQPSARFINRKQCYITPPYWPYRGGPTIPPIFNRIVLSGPWSSPWRLINLKGLLRWWLDQILYLSIIL